MLFAIDAECVYASIYNNIIQAATDYPVQIKLPVVISFFYSFMVGTESD